MNICERVMAESDGRITDVCIHLYYKLFDIKLLTLKITIMKKRLLSHWIFLRIQNYYMSTRSISIIVSGIYSTMLLNIPETNRLLRWLVPSLKKRPVLSLLTTVLEFHGITGKKCSARSSAPQRPQW